ncbi:MAG TPA: hypothetical protein VE505_03055 [Vicinamibacterales bacterium]|nr:hypothetical protein [Vicinamibacterales bacterium]
MCADRAVNVGCVPGEEDAARAIVRGLAMMQVEVAEPCRITEDQSTTRRFVDDVLQLLEREVTHGGVTTHSGHSFSFGAIARSGDYAPCRRRTEREEHGDALSDRERVKGVALERPVDLDVAEHEILEIRVALERDARPLPHRTVGSVASDEVTCPNLFLATIRMTKQALHTIRLRHCVDQLHTTFDYYPDRREVVPKHGFSFGLRDEENEWKASIGHAEVAESCLGGAPIVEMEEKASAGIAAANQILSESQTLENFQAASLYPEGARFMDAIRRAIDYAELHAEAGKAGREREPSRAGTDDQSIEHSRAHPSIHSLHDPNKAWQHC